jgi:Ribbon-helix-helix protein, copG family
MERQVNEGLPAARRLRGPPPCFRRRWTVTAIPSRISQRGEGREPVRLVQNYPGQLSVKKAAAPAMADRTRLTVELPGFTLARLDALAAEQGLSRSRLVRTLIESAREDAPAIDARCERAARSPHRMSYAAVGAPNQVVSASMSPGWVRSPTQATYPSGRINTAVGAVTDPSAGSSHAPTYSASIN